MSVVDRDLCFDVPLYSVAEAARYLGVANTTFSSWAKGYVRRAPGEQPVSSAPVLSMISSADGASVPFVALVEGMVLAAIRKTGVPMQRIRPALLALQNHLGIDHALANQRLYSDGAEVLFDFGSPVHLAVGNDAMPSVGLQLRGRHLLLRGLDPAGPR